MNNKNQYNNIEFSDFHGGVVSSQGLLGCDNPEDLDLNVYRSY